MRKWTDRILAELTTCGRSRPRRRVWPQFVLAVFFVAMPPLTEGMSWAPAGAGTAWAQMPMGDPVEEYGIRVARVKYGGGGDWYADPSSIPNWLTEFERRTGIKTHQEEKVVSLTDENLRAYPFLYLTGHGTVRLTGEELSALRRHLEAGGFLYADDNYGMDRSFRSLVRKLFPENDLEELPNSHPIYHSFYDLPGLPKIHEHDGKTPQGFGVTVDGRLLIFYSYESDIGDGLEDANVHNDTPEKRELATKMAVNILMYAIMQNALSFPG